MRFNTNPRYGAIDQAREDTLLRLQSRFAALPGVVAVVPQENADDYFEAVVHRADQIGEEPERPIAVRAQAAPAGYFSLMGMPVVRGRDFDAALREDRTSVVIGAATATGSGPGPIRSGGGSPASHRLDAERRSPSSAWSTKPGRGCGMPGTRCACSCRTSASRAAS